MDHYLTTAEEMDAALTRLLALGLIEFRNGGYAISEQCVAINAEHGAEVAAHIVTEVNEDHRVVPATCGWPLVCGSVVRSADAA